jgi:hypothetical protein
MKEDGKKEGNSAQQKADLLAQLANSLEQAEEKLEKYYMKEDHEQFKVMREFILKTQKRISETIR